jgi:hypothetical protein
MRPPRILWSAWARWTALSKGVSTPRWWSAKAWPCDVHPSNHAPVFDWNVRKSNQFTCYYFSCYLLTEQIPAINTSKQNLVDIIKKTVTFQSLKQTES